MAEDETKLSDASAECSAPADEYAKNQVLRKEIVAMSTVAIVLVMNLPSAEASS